MRSTISSISFSLLSIRREMSPHSSRVRRGVARAPEVGHYFCVALACGAAAPFFPVDASCAAFFFTALAGKGAGKGAVSEASADFASAGWVAASPAAS